ncbi:PAS domain S-box protein [Paenibacillus turpanensis]|uniref:PAS domain S-box protein n=1 Tax=Paenibacillus turpanensis TaxID=2689078 RepID=UPI001407DDBE|nr:PAS domain S-box protein [Paenibacillus turpanensis]
MLQNSRQENENRSLKEQIARLEQRICELEGRATETLSEHYKRLVEDTLMPIGIHKGGYFTYLNTAAQQLIALPPDTPYVGTPLVDVIYPEDRTTFQESLALMLAEKYCQAVQLRIKRMDGEVRLIDATGFYDERTDSFHFICQDITREEESRMQLVESRERYRSLFEYNSSIIVEIDKTGVIRELNPAFSYITGRLREEYLGRPYTEILPEEAKLDTVSIFEGVLQGGSGEVGFLGKHADGSRLDFACTYTPIYTGGEITGVYVLAQDVTLQKQAQEALSRSEATYRLITDNMSDVVMLLNEDGTASYCTPSIRKATGYPPEYFYKHSALEHVHPDDVKLACTELQKIQDEKQRSLFRFRMIHSSGGVLTVEASLAPLLSESGEVTAVLVTVRDISKQSAVEAALYENEQNFRRLVERSPQPMGLYRDSLLLYLNPAGMELLGITDSDSVEGISLLDFVHPLYRRRVLQWLQQNQVADYSQVELKLVTRDGRLRLVEVTGVYEPNKKAMQFIMTDVTDSRESRSKLMESEERYRMLTELSPKSIVVHKRGRVVYANPAFVSLMHFSSKEDVVGQELMDWMLPQEGIVLPHTEIEAVGSSAGHTVPHQAKMVTVKGVIDVELAGAPIRYDGHKANLLVIRDVTKIKQVEELKRVAAQKIRESEERYSRLHESLDRFSMEMFGVFRLDEIELRLINEVRSVLNLEDIAIYELDESGGLRLRRGSSIRFADEEGLSSLLRSDLPACSLGSADGVYYVNLGESEGTRVYLLLRSEADKLTLSSEQAWLETVSRFVYVLFDNFRVITDLTKKVEQVHFYTETTPWLRRFFFHFAENERKRLSQDLHDSALQEQIIWYRRLEDIRSRTGLKPEACEELKQVSEGLLDVIYQIRITCNELRPPMIKELGLAASLKALFEATQLRHDFSIDFHTDGFQERGPEELLIGIYRIIQELIANAVKHSNATLVQISLESIAGGAVLMTYEDDGIGIDPDMLQDSYHSMGVYGIKERVRSFDGTIEFHSKPMKGLSINIHIPQPEDGGGFMAGGSL